MKIAIIIVISSAIVILSSTIGFSAIGTNKHEIDSLINLLKKPQHDSTKYKIYYNLGFQYFYISQDSVIFYQKKAVQSAEQLKDDLKAAKAMQIIGVCYSNLSLYDSAMVFFDQAEKKLQKYLNGSDKQKRDKAKEIIAALYHNSAGVYQDQGYFSKALALYFKALKVNEETGNKRFQTANYGNIGIVYKEQGDYLHARDYFKKSLKLSEELNDTRGIAMSIVNIGVTYNEINENDKALEYYLKAVVILDSLGDKKNLAVNVGNIGAIYSEKGDYNSALKYLSKQIELDEEIGEMPNLCDAYGNLGVVYMHQKKYTLAEEYMRKSLDIATSMNLMPNIPPAYAILSELYEKTGKTQKALDYYKKSVLYRDSLMNDENKKAAVKLEMQYHFEKKAALDSLANIKTMQIKDAELKEQKAVSNQQRLILIFVIVSLIMVAIFTVFVIKRLTITRRQKRVIEKQKSLVDEKNELLNQQNAEIAAQRDLVVQQKDHIQQIHQELTDSISYAKRIQNSALPNLNQVKGHFSDIFILFKPKDVVSGDFYWYAEVENQIVLTVADCTGHGVPGAFMSMMGISMLKEIVVNEFVSQPDVILRKLRKEVIRALGQKGESGEQKDGMDISLCSINKETLKLQWSGANNSCFLIQKGEMKELKADKMPIAIYDIMEKFTLHEIQLEKGDIIYLSGDGYPDQFGGPSGKKYMSKRFKELLLSNSGKPLEEQKEILEKTIENWKNGYGKIYEQTDDITIMGIKI